MESENPIGLESVEFIEFTSPDPKKLEDLFIKFGFKKLAKHKQKNVDLFRQGRINLILNNEPSSFAEQFKANHGPSACALGLKVKNAEFAFKKAVERGATPYERVGHGSTKGRFIPAIYGIGGSLNYFVDVQNGKSIYDDDFEFLTSEREHIGYGFSFVDHLTNNVPRGKMDEWADYYRRIFNFQEIRYFDIKGRKTGLLSRAMRAPNGAFAIPINEPSDDKSQIQEYLDEYKGPGIQHIAFSTDNILQSVIKAKEAGIEFQDTNDSYYELLPKRELNFSEPLQRLKEQKVLVDGDSKGYLLQIFTKNLIGPIFVEVIQRKGHDGFGEGNFQALFDSMELDQMKRGYL